MAFFYLGSGKSGILPMQIWWMELVDSIKMRLSFHYLFKFIQDHFAFNAGFYNLMDLNVLKHFSFVNN